MSFTKYPYVPVRVLIGPPATPCVPVTGAIQLSITHVEFVDTFGTTGPFRNLETNTSPPPGVVSYAPGVTGKSLDQDFAPFSLEPARNI